MRNMFNVLYTRYIDQIKVQEIQNYKEKHRDYFVRSGKQANNSEYFHTFKNNSKPQNNQTRSNKTPKNQNNQNSHNSLKENNPRKKQFPVNKQIANLKSINSNQGRPIKPGNNNYSFTEYPQQYTLKNKQINQRPINNAPTQNQQENVEKPSIKYPKQREIKSCDEIHKLNDQMTQFAEEQDNIVLQQCRQGCGRKFKPETLLKHAKICQKIFQAKRKPFKVDVVDDEAKKIAIKNQKNESKNQKPKQQKMPKWKKESEMLRKGLKAQEASSSQSIPVQEEDDRVECRGCGRKFNEDAAARHIEKCISRNRQKR